MTFFPASKLVAEIMQTGRFAFFMNHTIQHLDFISRLFLPNKEPQLTNIKHFPVSLSNSSKLLYEHLVIETSVYISLSTHNKHKKHIYSHPSVMKFLLS